LLALKRWVTVTSIFHQMCTSYYKAITAGWCIHPTPKIVVDCEKPEKEQVSMRDWEGGNSPGLDSFKVTWDKNPGTRALSWNTSRRWSMFSWGQEAFLPEEALYSTHRKGESGVGVWNTNCPLWHSSHDPDSVLGFSIKECMEVREIFIPVTYVLTPMGGLRIQTQEETGL
jgi:hypothetical protein